MVKQDSNWGSLNPALPFASCGSPSPCSSLPQNPVSWLIYEFQEKLRRTHDFICSLQGVCGTSQLLGELKHHPSLYSLPSPPPTQHNLIHPSRSTDREHSKNVLLGVAAFGQKKVKVLASVRRALWVNFSLSSFSWFSSPLALFSSRMMLRTGLSPALGRAPQP